MRSAGRVLVVDEDAAVLEVIEPALRAEGYTVATARDAGTALDELWASWDVQPDAILLDVNLAAPDVAAFAELYQSLPVRHAPLILMSDAPGEPAPGASGGRDAPAADEPPETPAAPEASGAPATPDPEAAPPGDGDVLHKPIDLAQLLTRLHQATRDAAGPDAPGAVAPPGEPRRRDPEAAGG